MDDQINKSEMNTKQPEEADAKKRRRAFNREPIFNYIPKKRWPAAGLLAYQIVMPYIVISTVQSTAFLVAFVFYLSSGEGSGFLDKINSISGSMSSSNTIVFDSTMFDSLMKLIMGVLQTKPFLIAMAVGYLIVIAVYLLIVRVFEKRSVSSMGLPFHSAGEKKKALFSYACGLCIGLGMMLAVFLLLLATGQAKVTGFGLGASSISLFIIYILMWIPQGASEEIMTRGYMMPRLSTRFGRAGAVAISSLYFGILHTGNSGFSFIAFINLILVAVFFAVLAIYLQSIWTVCAVHSIWNFAQGNLFGFEVSGLGPSASIFKTENAKTSYDILTGGAFGPEGGLIVSAVVIFSLLILVWIYQKKIKAEGIAL